MEEVMLGMNSKEVQWRNRPRSAAGRPTAKVPIIVDIWAYLRTKKCPQMGERSLYRHGKAPCKRQGERHKGTSQLNPSHLHWPKDETHLWTMCTYARSFNSMSAKTSTMLSLVKSAQLRV